MTLPHDDPLDPATPRPGDPRTAEAADDRTADYDATRTAQADPAPRTEDPDSAARTADADPVDGMATPVAADRPVHAERPEYSVDQVGDDQAPVIPSEDRTTDPLTDPNATPDAATAGTPTAPAHSTSDEPLMTPSDAVDFKARWDVVQQGFVDDPRSAVTDADKLVSEVLERLSAMFDEQRKTLEGRWSEGEPDTEDLRSALQRYRAFFQRLLSI
ncbi:hypothetical protein [Kribbella sp. CA-294648]|uniref:hypothetical protein n=1 Tax=Kribbella sp. CA-294648 TaxID=3239948 RepID=UPI003D94C4DA